MSSKKINARSQKWRIMIGEGIFRDRQLLKSRIRKGIPPPVRAIAWPQIIKLGNFIHQHKNEYTYPKLINSPSSSIYEIGLDIPRTFPQEQDTPVLRKSLNNVLKAISIVYPKVGYCQGMNFLALRLLQIIDDEQTFWILNYLFDKDENLMKNFIDPKRIEEQSYVFHQLMKTFIPKIQEKLESQSMMIQIFTVKWFMTIFSSVLSQQLFYRVFQVYLNEGWTVIYAVGLALLKIRQSKILSNNFQGNLLMVNSQLYQITNIDEFMQQVFQFEITQAAINNHVSDYKIQQRSKEKKSEGETSRNSSIIKDRQMKNKNPVLPIPQSEGQTELRMQSKSQEITFQIFGLLDQTKFRQ